MGITRVPHPTIPGEFRYRVRLPRSHGRKGIGYYDSEEEAQRTLDAVLAELNPGKGMTLHTWGEIWLNRRKQAGLHRSWKNDGSKWRSHVEKAHFIDRPLRRITRQDVVRWVKDRLRADAMHMGESLGRNVHRRTVSKALNLLRCALQDAADDGRCASNVARDVRVPKTPGKEDPMVFLSLEELAALLSCKPPRRASKQARTIHLVMAYAAIRPSELWRLRWCDVRLDGPRPEVAIVGATKSTEFRHVPLLGPARDALRALPRGIGKALVFPGKGGQPHCDGYDAGWASWRKASGINARCRLYDLRHTCASHLLMGSGRGYPAEPWSMERVSFFLGHSDIRVTQRHYARFVPGWLDASAERARMDWDSGTKPGP